MDSVILALVRAYYMCAFTNTSYLVRLRRYRTHADIDATPDERLQRSHADCLLVAVRRTNVDCAAVGVRLQFVALEQLVKRDVCIARTAYGLFEELAHGGLVRGDGVVRRRALALAGPVLDGVSDDTAATQTSTI